MSQLTDRLMANIRITPISQPNRVKQVCKGHDGSLQVTLNSGKVFSVAKDDEMFQTFVVYSMLAEL